MVDNNCYVSFLNKGGDFSSQLKLVSNFELSSPSLWRTNLHKSKVFNMLSSFYHLVEFQNTMGIAWKVVKRIKVYLQWTKIIGKPFVTKQDKNLMWAFAWI